MDFLDLVSRARTCRRYQGTRELEPGTLPWLVNCARLGPSAANLQPLRYLAVSSPEKRREFYPALAWAAYLKDWPGPDEGERPTGYIVLLAPSGKDGKIGHHTWMDVGIAAQNMQLAAWSKGIGACMFGAFNKRLIAETLPLPDGYEVVLVMAFGFALEERRIVPLAQPEDEGGLRYYREPSGLHCVPKRALGDVLLGEL